MAECAGTETETSPHGTDTSSSPAKKPFYTKGNVIIFAMDGSDIAINALKCEYWCLTRLVSSVTTTERHCYKCTDMWVLVSNTSSPLCNNHRVSFIVLHLLVFLFSSKNRSVCNQPLVLWITKRDKFNSVWVYVLQFLANLIAPEFLFSITLKCTVMFVFCTYIFENTLCLKLPEIGPTKRNFSSKYT